MWEVLAEPQRYRPNPAEDAEARLAAEIAERLGLSVRAVEGHTNRAMTKIGVSDPRELRKTH
jgi:hypothetical protein